MIINNTHIQGIYLYDELAEYEKGDFVISGNSIYICTAEKPTNNILFTVSGKDPKQDSDNFKIYLGDKITSLKEYLDYVSNPDDSEDKLVSSHVLSEILNNYMNGFDGKGIINNYLLYRNEEYSFSKSLESIFNGVRNNFLNVLIKSETFNNGILYVSRDLPEIAEIIPSLPEDLTGVDPNDKLSVILKQYTYLNNGVTKVRVQELIDHVNGIVMYRYDSGGTSSWKQSFLNIDFRNEVLYVKNYYEKKITELELEKEKLKGSFGYREVKLSKESQIVLQNTNPDGSGYTGNRPYSSPNVITIVIQEPLGNNLFKNNSITIDISDSLGSSSISEYNISTTNSLILTNVTESSAIIQVTSGIIVNIYYRNYYE